MGRFSGLCSKDGCGVLQQLVNGLRFDADEPLNLLPRWGVNEPSQASF